MVDQRVFGLNKSSGTDSGQVEGSCAAVRLIAYCGVLGAKSILDCPDKLKTFGDIFGLPKVSQSSIHNMISATTEDASREDAYAMAKMLQRDGMLKIKLENKKRKSVAVLHLDGSKVMTHYGVSGTFGGRINYSLDFVPCERGGQEIAKSLEICKRAKEKGIRIDIVTNDGIGYCREYYKELKSLGIDAFIRIRGDDKRNLQFIRDFEQALKMREILRMPAETLVAIYDDIKFTVTQLLDTDPVSKEPILVARIESEPVGKKLERLKRKEAKRKKKVGGEKEFHYAWEEDPEWEKMSEYKMTHYVETTATYLLPLDVLNIFVDHWTVEIHWRKVKRAYWSRNSYKKSAEGMVTLFISVCIGIAVAELIKHKVLLEDTDEVTEAGIIVLHIRPQEEKNWTLKRVRDYVNESARSRYFEIAAAA